MGIFSRRRDAPDADAGERHRIPHAAFDPADVEDAVRGRPAGTLEPFAAAAGLDYRGSEQAGYFLSTLPIWPDYIFNVCRGASPGGRLAQVGHELHEMRAHNGHHYPDGLHHLRPRRVTGFVEVGGIVVNEKNEPFGSNAVWIPTTAAHIRAPELARLPVIRITRFTPSADRAQPNHLGPRGLPGYWVMEGDRDAGLFAAVADAVRPFLTARDDVHVNLRVQYGLVALTVNGYRTDPADLDHLIGCADGIAGALGALLPGPSGAPFGAAGPPAMSLPFPEGAAPPGRDVAAAYAQAAQELGMVNEDATHLRAMAPGYTIPGIATGVLFGTLPGLTAPCRVVWHQHGFHTQTTFRGGAVMEAAPGAATPLGGTLVAGSGMYVEVAGGVACCWVQRRTEGRLDSAALVRSAADTLRASGLVAT